MPPTPRSLSSALGSQVHTTPVSTAVGWLVSASWSLILDFAVPLCLSLGVSKLDFSPKPLLLYKPASRGQMLWSPSKQGLLAFPPFSFPFFSFFPLLCSSLSDNFHGRIYSVPSGGWAGSKASVGLSALLLRGLILHHHSDMGLSSSWSGHRAPNMQTTLL